MPPNHVTGAPGSFCPSMSYASKWPVSVDRLRFRHAASDALAATGLKALACDCSDGADTGAHWWTNGNGGLR